MDFALRISNHSEKKKPGDSLIRLDQRPFEKNVCNLKYSFLICVLIFAACLGVTVPAGASTPTVTISDFNVTPSVLLPGATGTISFTVMSTDQSARSQESTGIVGNAFANTQDTAINVFIRNIHVEGNGVIILTKDFDRVGDIGPGQRIPITLLIQAPDRDGMYFPEIWIDTGTGIGDGTSTRYPVPVNVNTRISIIRKSDLSVEKVLPGSVVPGTDFSGFITVRNDGEGRADDIFVAVNTSSPSISLSSPANYHLDHLDPGENASFDMKFSSGKDAALGIVPVPLTINYADADGTREFITENLGIPFRGRAQMAVKSFSADPDQPDSGAQVILTIRIENTGTDRADSVKAYLSTPLAGTKEAFIGSIDKNSDAPAIFTLRATQSGQVPLAINITYNDDYGFHTLTENATLNVNSPGLPMAVVPVLILLVAGAAYWFLRIRKRGDHA